MNAFCCFLNDRIQFERSLYVFYYVDATYIQRQFIHVLQFSSQRSLLLQSRCVRILLPLDMYIRQLVPILMQAYSSMYLFMVTQAVSLLYLHIYSHCNTFRRFLWISSIGVSGIFLSLKQGRDFCLRGIRPRPWGGCAPHAFSLLIPQVPIPVVMAIIYTYAHHICTKHTHTHTTYVHAHRTRTPHTHTHTTHAHPTPHIDTSPYSYSSLLCNTWFLL